MPTAPNVPSPNTVFGQPKLPGQAPAAAAPQPAPAPAPTAQPAVPLPQGVIYNTNQANSVVSQSGDLSRKLKAQGLVPGTPEFKAAYDAGYNQITQPINNQAIAGAGQLYRDGSGNLTTQSSVNGVKLTPVQAGGTAKPSMTAIGQWENYAPQASASLGGEPGNPYSPGGVGSFAGQTNAALQMQGAAAQGRAGPQINTGATNMIMSGAGQSLGQANGTNLLGLGNAGNLADTATGAGYQGTMNAADRLAALGQMPAGPSVAQQQLQQGGDAAMQQQMAMASAARGGNAGLALQNAGVNQGQIMGNLNAQMGIQRAQEDMANRQFAGQMTGAAGQMYGQGAGIQQAGYGGAGQELGTIGAQQLGAAGVQTDIGKTYAGMAGQQLGADMGQRSLNDSTMLASQGMGLDVLEKERAAVIGQQQNQANENITAYGINRGVQAQQDLLHQQQQNDWMHQIIGGTVAAAGAVAAPFTGGASLAVEPYAVQQLSSSDIRAKKDIKPADAAVSNAFRAANADADAIRGTDVQYPIGAYSYEYKNSNAPGAAPGTHYGPMAQDLEKTSAGSSVVHTMPNGQKGIDTSRLSLLSASEIAKQRAELDALKQQIYLGAPQRAPMIPQLPSANPYTGQLGMGA